LLPPNTLLFIKNLRSADMQGKNVIVNTYATPFSYELNSWGFNYPVQTSVDLTKKLVISTNELRYLWYRNKQDTAMYSQQDMFICFEPNSISAVATELYNDGNYNTSCTRQYLAIGELINANNANNPKNKNGSNGGSITNGSHGISKHGFEITNSWRNLYKREADLKFYDKDGNLDFMRPSSQWEARRWGIFRFNFGSNILEVKK
jgi:hypothetical protein